MIEIYLVFLVIVNLLIYFFHAKLRFFGVPFDVPDKKRKFHIGPVLISGGLILFINIFLLIIIMTIENSSIFPFLAEIKKIFFFSLLFFIFGFLDDKLDLNPWLKFFLMSIFLLFILLIEESLIIRELRFSFLNHTLNLGSYSIFITLLCYLLFINSFNMFDGINLQSSIFSGSFILYFFYIKFAIEINILILPSLILFILLNYKNESFLGDGGCYLISFILGSFSILAYNLKLIPYCDYIFILMILPGIDMLRLFFTRALNKNSPFRSDRNHIHHLILKFTNYKYTILILGGFIILNITMLFFKVDTRLILFLFLFLYSYLIFRFRN